VASSFLAERLKVLSECRDAAVEVLAEDLVDKLLTGIFEGDSTDSIWKHGQDLFGSEIYKVGLLSFCFHNHTRRYTLHTRSCVYVCVYVCMCVQYVCACMCGGCAGVRVCGCVDVDV